MEDRQIGLLGDDTRRAATHRGVTAVSSRRRVIHEHAVRTGPLHHRHHACSLAHVVVILVIEVACSLQLPYQPLLLLLAQPLRPLALLPFTLLPQPALLPRLDLQLLRLLRQLRLMCLLSQAGPYCLLLASQRILSFLGGLPVQCCRINLPQRFCSIRLRGGAKFCSMSEDISSSRSLHLGSCW